MKQTKKPNFIVIGSMKSGTSTLCSLLGQHPAVFMSSPKEPEFFCKDDIYARGWDWYLSLFADARNSAAIGEGSTSYTKAPLFPKVPERIARHLPDVRLVYIVRHPLERIESHWMHRVQHGDSRPFKKMLRKYPNLIDTGRYWSQIQRYRKYFGDDQILVLFFEDLKKNPEGVMNQCFSFLDVDPDVKLTNPSERRNVTRQFKAESMLLKAMRDNTPMGYASRLIPASFKKLIKARLEIQVDSRPSWDREMRRWVIDEIVEDVRTFLNFYGKPVDYWDLRST